MRFVMVSACAGMMLGGPLARAQPAGFIEDLGAEIQLRADGGRLVVAVDRQDQPRLRFYDFATHKQVGTSRALGPDVNLDLADGKTFLAKDALYADATTAKVQDVGHLRSMVRGIAARGGVYAIAGTEDGKLIGIDAKGRHELDLAADEPELGMTFAVAFSPDGKRVAVGSTGHFVVEVDAATWKVARKVLRAPGAIRALAYAGGALVIGVDTGGDEALIVVDAATGKPLEGPGKKPTAGVRALALSPDGAYLAVSGDGQRIHVYAVATWKQKAFLDGAFNPVIGLAWSGDGKYLASATSAGELRIWTPFGE